MECRICGADAVAFSDVAVLHKYNVSYYRCAVCGAVETEQPYWLEEAYSNAIADADIGLLGRNVYLSSVVSAIMKFCLSTTNKCLDFGGGYGTFVRMMRDQGFDFQWYDKYATNIFAKGHERSEEHYDVLTAFELFEHLPDPQHELDELFHQADTVICSTALLPSEAPQPGSWWYYAPTTGQHVMFYTPVAMEYIARKYGKVWSHVGDIHIFSDKKIPAWRLRLCNRLPRLINRLYRRTSLLASDYEKITGEKL